MRAFGTDSRWRRPMPATSHMSLSSENRQRSETVFLCLLKQDATAKFLRNVRMSLTNSSDYTIAISKTKDIAQTLHNFTVCHFDCATETQLARRSDRDGLTF
jgi:hypothetical protein